VLQQVPSTQFPEPHSVLAVQAVPFGLLQVPSPFALHFSPVPHDEDEQQTPSTQLPLAHSVALPHVLPSVSFGMQLAAEQ
jgi:hypothetical protein